MNMHETALRVMDLLDERARLKEQQQIIVGLLSDLHDLACEGLELAGDNPPYEILQITAWLSDIPGFFEATVESVVLSKRLACIDAELRGLVIGEGGIPLPYALSVGFGDSAFGEMMRLFVVGDLGARTFHG
jgi:hypothetical protein